MVKNKSHCLVFENNFLIGLDLEEMLRARGIAAVDLSRNFVDAVERITRSNYTAVFIDFDGDLEQAQQLASLVKSNGSTAILTSTTMLRQDLPAWMSDHIILSKPFSEKEMNNLLDNM